MREEQRRRFDPERAERIRREAWAAFGAPEGLGACTEPTLAAWTALRGVDGRVAVGSYTGPGGPVGEHAWVVTGMDVYDPDAYVVDVSRWAYADPAHRTPAVWVGLARTGWHRPYGSGSILRGGSLPRRVPGATPISLAVPVSDFARRFLDRLGPLDLAAWRELLGGPMGDWPSREIVEAAAVTPDLAPVITEPILGMVTDWNPGGRYLRGPEQRPPLALAL